MIGFNPKIWIKYVETRRKAVLDYFTDIHPKTQEQFRHQQFFAGWNPLYSGWMQSRSQDERNSNTLQQYGITWSDIRYPWLMGLSTGNTANSLGSVSNWMYSKNVGLLYR